MGVSEIFRISGAKGWKKLNRLNSCNIWAQMLTTRAADLNRYALLPYKTVCISATLYRVAITMALKLKGIILVNSRFNLKSICKRPWAV
jgi:hypothetical protein